MDKGILKIVFVALIFIAITAGLGYSEELDWDVFSTEFCTVFCEKGLDLKAIARRINLTFSSFYSVKAKKDLTQVSLEGTLSDKLDAIFDRVQEVLDMYPQKIHVAIKIFRNQENLDRVYEDFFSDSKTLKAFYIYTTNTIYTSEEAIDEKVLAHEMAHCIMDHYFIILPPSKIQEILASFADVNLNK